MSFIEVCGLIGSEISRRRCARLSDQERFDNKTKLSVSLLTIKCFLFGFASRFSFLIARSG